MPERFQEPRLLDLLQDPTAEIMMARDGVSRDAIMSLLTWVATRRTVEAPTSRGAAGGR